MNGIGLVSWLKFHLLVGGNQPICRDCNPFTSSTVTKYQQDILVWIFWGMDVGRKKSETQDEIHGEVAKL